MQSAKDTFYVMLRDRIAEINPGRTAVVRGVSRPAVLVIENELTTDVSRTGTFCLRWAEMKFDAADGLVTMPCEVEYATDGSAEGGGMDRGRSLAAMDLELFTALRREPQSAAKTMYSADEVQPMLTRVFWSEPVLRSVSAKGERVSRTVAVEVFAYPEAGEL